MEYDWITAHSSTSDEGRPITVSQLDSPDAHPFRAIAARVRSDARLYDPKGTRQRDALRRGMALKETLERRAHRFSLLCQ
jgi:hypothetical protein